MKKIEYNSCTDEELLARLNEDEEAFNEIYHRYHRLVYFIAYQLCRNDADAQDILQDTFLKVKKSSHQIKDPSKFKAWLNVVTVSSCKDLFKRNRHQLYDSDFDIKIATYAENRTYMIPEAQMHYNSDEMQLSRFIMRLPDSQREVIVMKFYEQRSIQDIAKILDISEGTVKSRIHYGKNLLHGMLKDYNRKNPEHSLDFKMLDLLTPVSIGWLLAPKKVVSNIKHILVANPMVAMGVVISTIGVSGAGAWTLAQNKDNAPVVQRSSENIVESDSRKLYFYLMDWAACKSDMQGKSMEEYEQVLPTYQKLKTSNDEYFTLLKKMEWEKNFIDVFQNNN